MKAFVLGLILGSIAILAIEAALLLYLLKLLRKKSSKSSKSSCVNSDANPNQSLDFAFNTKKKVGFIFYIRSIKFGGFLQLMNHKC